MVFRIDVTGGEQLSPVWHGKNATNRTGIISRRCQSVPSSVAWSQTAEHDHTPEEDTTKGHEQPDDDGRRGRACHMIGFLEHDPHDEGSFCRTITILIQL